MSKNQISVSGNSIMQQIGGQPKPDEVFDAELAAQMVKRTDKLQNQEIELAIRVKQAREFIAWSAAHVRVSWLDWMDEANNGTRQMNEVRMAFERESKTIKAAAKDIQDFFNSPDYLKAHATLGETVQLLEKFGKMKADGTLDAFADFILKVTCK